MAIEASLREAREREEAAAGLGEARQAEARGAEAETGLIQEHILISK